MPYNIIPIVCARRTCTARLLDVNCSSTATMPSRCVTDNVMRTDLCKYYFTCGPNSNGGVLRNPRVLYTLPRAQSSRLSRINGLYNYCYYHRHRAAVIPPTRSGSRRISRNNITTNETFRFQHGITRNVRSHNYIYIYIYWP